jgi:lysophospholipase L1-like esterase
MGDAPCPPVPANPDPAWWNALGSYIRGHDWPWLCRYAGENAAIKQRPSVVFMGDSITEGWVEQDPALFGPARLGRGISGQTTPQMLLRFWQDVIALKPQVVHILAGTNDIAGNNGPTSPEEYQNNIRAMVALARANRIAVILGAIPPAARFSWQPVVKPTARIAALNAWLKSFAAREHLVFADYHTALATPEGVMKPELSPDGVHPNAAGYKLMRPVTEAAIATALKAAR